VSSANPLLFTLLDAMDGVGSDADVTFMLTTNRADILEHALADRPGRVDLAIEIPRPDAVSRERLLRLYTGDVALDGGVSAVVAATEGATASFIKELVRRAVLAALRAGGRPLVLSQAHFDEVLAEMNAEHQSLTRSLLGGDAGGRGPAPAGHRPAEPQVAALALRPATAR
jgi:ATP-dependent 26S proteasome regulatory subunit